MKTDASGSVIDFVMHRQGGSLGYIRKALRAYAPSSFPTTHPAAIPKPRPISYDRAALVAQWHRFTPYRGNHLQTRGLNAATVRATNERLRADERGNVLFRHDDRNGLTGWEIKNLGFTGFSAGGRKALFAVRIGIPPKTEPPRVVVTESAIDALSYYQLHPAPALLLSFGGGLSLEQKELLRHVLTKYPAASVVTATDNDDQGEAFAAILATIRPDAVRARSPIGKDWNDSINLRTGPFSGRGGGGG